jgi:hypothetical protein
MQCEPRHRSTGAIRDIPKLVFTRMVIEEAVRRHPVKFLA